MGCQIINQKMALWCAVRRLQGAGCEGMLSLTCISQSALPTGLLQIDRLSCATQYGSPQLFWRGASFCNSLINQFNGSPTDAAGAVRTNESSAISPACTFRRLSSRRFNAFVHFTGTFPLSAGHMAGGPAPAFRTFAPRRMSSQEQRELRSNIF
jgi:hypothetical protein